MRFECQNRNCREYNEKLGYTEHFRFRAKPTVDERSQCPKCGTWASKCGHSAKDLPIREIDILFKKHTGIAMTEYQYKHLNTWKVERLKEAVVEIKLALGVIE